MKTTDVTKRISNISSIKTSVRKIILSCLLTASLIGSAFGNQEANDICKEQERAASVVMQARQAGVPLSKMLEIGKDEPLVIAFVRMAFTYPKYRTEEYRQETIDNFANTAYIMCRKSLS